MKFALFIGLGNTTWDSVLSLTRHAEATGWDAACLTDHFMPNTPDRVGDNIECLGTLAALAAAVPRIRLGSIVLGNTYRHPAVPAKMLTNIDILKRERLNQHVLEHERAFRAMLESLRDIPIVGDVRGAGYFQAIELVKDQGTKASFSDEESEVLLRGFLSGELYRRGLICRADDRGDPVIQISPPLVAGQAEFDELTGILGDVLAEAWRLL